MPKLVNADFCTLLRFTARSALDRDRRFNVGGCPSSRVGRFAVLSASILLEDLDLPPVFPGINDAINRANSRGAALYFDAPGHMSASRIHYLVSLSHKSLSSVSLCCFHSFILSLLLAFCLGVGYRYAMDHCCAQARRHQRPRRTIANRSPMTVARTRVGFHSLYSARESVRSKLYRRRSTTRAAARSAAETTTRIVNATRRYITAAKRRQKSS